MVDYEIRGRVRRPQDQPPRGTQRRQRRRRQGHGSRHRPARGRRRRVAGDPHRTRATVFCAGADLKAINAGKAGDLQTEARRLRRHRQPRADQADHRRRRRPRPRRRHRDRAGCDLVVAVRRGRASASPRSSARWSPPPAGCSACRGCCPATIALELILTGDPITAERAAPLRPGERAVRARSGARARHGPSPTGSPPTRRSPCARAAMIALETVDAPDDGRAGSDRARG